MKSVRACSERGHEMKKKINITVDEKLLSEFDVVADELGMSRSSFLSMAGKTYIQQNTMIQQLPRLLNESERIRQESVSK